MTDDPPEHLRFDSRDMHSRLAACGRLAGFLAWSALIVPVYAIILACGRPTIPLCRRIARWYWAKTCRILSIDVVVRGNPVPQRPALFVSNHVSYIDILVLGAVLEAAFVAKKEVGAWPGIGLLAKLGRTVFVDRRRGSSRAQRDDMLERLTRTGESLILFPEGTSDDGNRVLPFKSALLSVAEPGDGAELPVQPITVAYTRLAGLPIGRAWRPFFAWYGDMDLAPHLWFLLGLGRLQVEVLFHDPVRLSDFGSRKALTDHCHDVVSRGLAAANCGRVPAPPPLPSPQPGETVAVG